MTDIKELALRVAREVQREQWGDDHELSKEDYAGISEFAQRFLAAYLAEQEPVDYRYQGTDGLWYRTIPVDVRVVQTQPLFTAPLLPEPAPEDKFCDDHCVWTDHHPDCKISGGAAPSSEEVREMVERLHDDRWALGMRDRRIAADLIERLAKQEQSK